MSNKHVNKKKFGDQIYNNTTAEYNSQKYRKNIAANWLSIIQKDPPENFTPTVIESERHRSNIQHIPRQNVIPSQTKPLKRASYSSIGDFDLNFDNNDPIDDFFDEENQFELDEDRRQTAINTKSKSTRKRNDYNEFLNVGHFSEQKKRTHKAEYPIAKKSKVKPNQIPIETDFESIVRHSRQLPTASRTKISDLIYSPIGPYQTDEDDFEQLFSPERELGNDQRKKRNNQLSADFHEMNEERKRSQEIIENRKNNDKHFYRKTPSHSNPFQNIENDFDMPPQQSSPFIIASRYQFNLEIPRERKQRRPITDEIEDDFEKSFRECDRRGKRQRSLQKTENQIDLAEKSLVKAERTLGRRFEVFNDDLMVIPHRYTGHDVVPGPRRITPHSILPRPAMQPIVYNIKCNNLIIKTDNPSAD